MRALLLVLVLVWLTACSEIAPASTPAQLDHTPGPPVQIYDGSIYTTTFTVDYPLDWRVVTSPAFSEPWIVLVSPEDNAVIVIATDADDTNVPPTDFDGDPVQERETVQLDNHAIVIVLNTSEAVIDDVRPWFDEVVASVREPDLSA